jgi:hypothetical protein
VQRRRSREHGLGHFCQTRFLGCLSASSENAKLTLDGRKYVGSRTLFLGIPQTDGPLPQVSEFWEEFKTAIRQFRLDWRQRAAHIRATDVSPHLTHEEDEAGTRCIAYVQGVMNTNELWHAIDVRDHNSMKHYCIDHDTDGTKLL